MTATAYTHRYDTTQSYTIKLVILANTHSHRPKIRQSNRSSVRHRIGQCQLIINLSPSKHGSCYLPAIDEANNNIQSYCECNLLDENQSCHFLVSSKFSLIQSNIQGLLGSVTKSISEAGSHVKLDFLRYLLSLKGAPSVLALTETKLSSRLLDSEIAIDGYDIIRHDRNRKGGGVIFYCRSELRPTWIIDCDSFNIELLGIKITMPCKKSLTIFCVYRPPSSSALWLNVFHAVLSQLSVVYHSVVMLGDFNFDLLKSSEFCDDMYQS